MKTWCATKTTNTICAFTKGRAHLAIGLDPLHLSSTRQRGRCFRQYRQYGYWKPFVMKKHGQAAALRHLVPGLFVAALIGLTLLMLGFGGLTLVAASATTLKWVSAWGTLVCSIALMALSLTYGLAVMLVSLSISRNSAAA